MKFLFILSILAFIGYGCNRGEDKGSAVGTGAQMETAPTNTTPAPATDVGSGAEERSMDETDLGTGAEMDDSAVPTDSTMDSQQKMEGTDHLGSGASDLDSDIDETQDNLDQSGEDVQR